MATIVAMVNLKGGVGKTALSVNFADYCASAGLKTLLVDLDPQTNATFSAMGIDEWDKHKDENGTVADLLGARDHLHPDGARKDINDVIAKNLLQGFDLVPSHLDLFTVDLDLAGKPNREGRLKRALRAVRDEYDVVVCDCPPNLTIPTQNAISASTHYVVPVSPDFLSAVGIALLKSRVADFCEDIDHKIDLGGIVLSRVGRPARRRSETIQSIRQQFSADVLDQQITERAVVAGAAEEAKSLKDFPDKSAKTEFEQVSKELLERIGIAE
ncbi:ParA family protein [Roseibium album]|uniref:ParA family protein n=1 Tax=Roseibium album TaxID=311410 RepID=UPI002491F49E|nr:AAA family ATPase [Roseibium album]